MKVTKYVVCDKDGTEDATILSGIGEGDEISATALYGTESQARNICDSINRDPVKVQHVREVHISLGKVVE